MYSVHTCLSGTDVVQFMAFSFGVFVCFPPIFQIFNIGLALVPIIGYFESIVIGKGFGKCCILNFQDNT